MNSAYDVSVDYFAILGLHYGACEQTVKMMYRKMARRYHPDVSMIHDAEKKFQEIAAAYEVLKKHRDVYCRDHEQHKKIIFGRRIRENSATSTPQTHPKHSAPTRDSKAKSESKSQPQTEPSSDASQQTEGTPYRYAKYTSGAQKPIDGKDRVITYPLTLRYAIRLLRLGSFYIPGLKVKMKFTREAFAGKTFRLEGKGYSGLFGGKQGDFLVRFDIKFDSIQFQLEGSDIYGVLSVPSTLLQKGKALELESPSGRLSFMIPIKYSSNDYIKVHSMGLPADEKQLEGDFYARLVMYS